MISKQQTAKIRNKNLIITNKSKIKKKKNKHNK